MQHFSRPDEIQTTSEYLKKKKNWSFHVNGQHKKMQLLRARAFEFFEKISFWRFLKNYCASLFRCKNTKSRLDANFYLDYSVFLLLLLLLFICLLVIIIIDIFSFFFMYLKTWKKRIAVLLIIHFDLRIASQTDRKRIGMTCG